MFNMSYRNYSRWVFVLIALAGAALISMGLYLQYQKNLYPCNLCLFQRFFIIATAVVCLMGWLHSLVINNPRALSAKVYAVIAFLLAVTGAVTAGRQLWLQNLPKDKVPECGPGLDYMMQTYPFMEMVLTVFKGSGDCAKVQWVFMGLSIPAWSFVCFCVAAILCLTIVFKRRA